MKTKTITTIMIVLLLASMLSLAFDVTPVSGHSGDVLSAWASVIPIIDGTISPGEWDEASTASFALTYPGESHDSTLYVKNDGTYLYLAVVIRDDDFYESNWFQIAFDNAHNGEFEEGEDFLVIQDYGGDIFDAFWLPTEITKRDTDDGGTNDILGGVIHSNPAGVGDYTVEFEHPLDTADDAHDFSLSIGDTVGFRIGYNDVEAGYFSYWPWGHVSKFGDIIIASPPPVGGLYVPVNKLQLMAPFIAVTGIFVAVVIVFKRRRI